MPKGGVLHAHISAINSRDFILGNITHRPNLYVCRKQDMLELRFLNKTRASSKRGCSWELLKTARERDKSIDKEIEKALIMYIDEPLGIDESIDGAWKKFLSIFYFIKSLVTYRYDLLKFFGLYLICLCCWFKSRVRLVLGELTMFHVSIMT